MEQPKKKSKAGAVASFVFGLTFWIPLLNLIFGIFAVYLGIKWLKNIKKEPEKYSGKAFAIIGIILGSIVYIAFLIGISLCLTTHDAICGYIGLPFLA